ncbi:hypothetical protein NADFUDRAFT_46127 [Nadsonia fulvescens var. elongata DSM 6958]|uniref:Uncharacterized protein n=1 Tax=Nadsonia fulvescens var. elongata DSM 6958 TaxID=857566 RepID=A0A1E3PPH4_9ASCO|nr:hypothetical protein NADFUDRAFT_46127 [Nadsonia fulvescens var. elongata DSM 6958]
MECGLTLHGWLVACGLWLEEINTLKVYSYLNSAITIAEFYKALVSVLFDKIVVYLSQLPCRLAVRL